MSLKLRIAVSTSIVVVSILQNSATAQELQDLLNNAPAILRVEEDWEVLVADPDPNLNIPQIVTVFGPTNSNFDTHTLFELNHGTLPSFGEGGMQLQVWNSDSLIGYHRQQAPTELAIPNEIIRYTTVTSLAILDHHLVMEVTNGTSSTFGQFGAPNYLKAVLHTHRTDLNPYEPSDSILNSRVTFGANRVTYFKRTAIRFYDGDGDLYVEDNTDTYVHKPN